jgi:hypothetical protein
VPSNGQLAFKIAIVHLSIQALKIGMDMEKISMRNGLLLGSDLILLREYRYGEMRELIMPM